MKYRTLLLSIMLLSSPLYAETIKLDIKNFTRDRITIIKSNGEEITLESFKDKKQVAFELPSVVKNYIDGKYVCSWDITSEKIFAIAYGMPMDGFCGVLTY